MMKKQELQDKSKIIAELHNQQHIEEFYDIAKITTSYIYDTMNTVADNGKFSLRIKLSNDWYDTEVKYHFSSYYHRDYVEYGITITDSRNTYFPNFNAVDMVRLYDIIAYDLRLNGYTVTELDYVNNYNKVKKTFFIYWGEQLLIDNKSSGWLGKILNFFRHNK